MNEWPIESRVKLVRVICLLGMKSLKRLRRRTKILICVAAVTIIVIAFFYGFWVEFQRYYLAVMKDLNTSETKAYMYDKINGTYNFTDLLYWTNQHLNWSNEDFVRYSNPQQILDQGKGRCEEFVIVYVSACLALGYEARILVARQFYLGPVHGFHLWAEVKLNDTWIQADPSPTPFWNDTSHYKSWDWGPRTTLFVSAFDANGIEDVSARYR